MEAEARRMRIKSISFHNLTSSLLPSPKERTGTANVLPQTRSHVAKPRLESTRPDSTKPESLKMNSPAVNSPSFTHVSRHDHHNIEIKSVVELNPRSQKVTTELYLFVPKSFEIGLAGKSELVKDLRTRLRLAIPSNEGFDDEDFAKALRDLSDANARLEAEAMVLHSLGQEIPSNLREGVLEAAKDVAAIVAERLKRLAIEHGRQFFVSQSLLVTASSRAAGFDSFVKNLQAVRRKIELIREAMKAKSQDGQTLNSLLDEYVSQLYVQYLGAIGSEFAQFESQMEKQPKVGDDSTGQESKNGSTLDSSASFNLAYARSRQMLKALKEDEAVYRKTRGLSFESETEIERERHLNRLSQLKKFFQSKTFIDVVKTQSAKRVTESSALIGTAAAGVTAALLEQWGRKNVATLASQGLLVVCLGVILYVLRDRMKDWARAKLQEKALGLIPDFETELVANQRQFGVSREWFQLLASKTCDAAILDARHAEFHIERSLRLPEDVMYARRVFHLEPCGFGNGQPRALHENVRLNLDRHLKFMDDPFKELTDLEDDGNFILSRSHRVYHFHVVTRTTIVEGKDAESSAFKTWITAIKMILRMKPTPPTPVSCVVTAHRVVLDKSGINRVEAMGT